MWWRFWFVCIIGFIDTTLICNLLIEQLSGDSSSCTATVSWGGISGCYPGHSPRPSVSGLRPQSLPPVWSEPTASLDSPSTLAGEHQSHSASLFVKRKWKYMHQTWLEPFLTSQQTATDLISLIPQTHTVYVVQRHVGLRQRELRLSAIHHQCGGAPQFLRYLG